MTFLMNGIRVRQGPTVLAVGTGEVFGFFFFSRLSYLFFLSSGRWPDTD